MPTLHDVRWFKTQFQQPIAAALVGTPLTVDFMTALACQETGEIWRVLRAAGLPTAEILRLCVGDTLDADRGRRAFPQTRADLLAASNGRQMFDIARQALLDMARHLPAYRPAAGNPRKFCHGFGLFQRDLQFFLADPAYFLERRYAQFDQTLAQAIGELGRAARKLGLDSQATLTDLELAALGIAYNTGGYRPSKGLRQGHFNGSRYYGEALYDYLRLAHTVAVEGEPPQQPPAAPGQAVVTPPTVVTAEGVPMRVKVSTGMLRLRSAPVISQPPQKNVIGHLPDGHPVRMLSARAHNGFVEVQTSLLGALLQGHAAKQYLEPAEPQTVIAVVQPQAELPAQGITAVHAPARPGVVARRRDPATALSLSEPGRPGRKGSTADALRQELAAVVAWLDVESPAHLRYKPRDGLTFCNIYAHDFCHLAGVYLPRVWWTAGALVELARGQEVTPRLGASIEEMRANGLFAWLRDFGPGFGWRATGTLTKLQTEVNQGAVGVIVARRKESRLSGHIAIVVPETAQHAARRNTAGEVVAPLQSQAGITNFRYGTGRTDWWRAEQFAEFAFWLHA